jgi:hypothetical protein
MKFDTWVLDCPECDGQMELEDIVNTTFSVEADGPSETTHQVWCCEKCGEWMTDIDRDNQGMEAYKMQRLSRLFYPY